MATAYFMNRFIKLNLLITMLIDLYIYEPIGNLQLCFDGYDLHRTTMRDTPNNRKFIYHMRPNKKINSAIMPYDGNPKNCSGYLLVSGGMLTALRIVTYIG